MNDDIDEDLKTKNVAEREWNRIWILAFRISRDDTYRKKNKCKDLSNHAVRAREDLTDKRLETND